MASNESEAKFEMNITLETYVPSSAHRWRVYGSPTAEEKNEYYKTYDPWTGARIAATLSGFFLAAVLYVVYKSKCKRTKMPRHASLIEQPSTEQQTWPSPWDNLLTSAELVDEESNVLDAGQQSPNSNIYYQDDSQMPPWKVYAKELFLYGPGLWRSTSLIGSAPLPNIPGCCPEDYALDNSRGSLAAVSLTGSLMGRLGSRSRQHNASCGSKSTLQVPSDFESGARARKRSLPMRSVSFRGPEPARPADSIYFKRTASLRTNLHGREKGQRKSVSSLASRQSSVSPCVSRQNSNRENPEQFAKKKLTERSASLLDKSSPGSWRSTFVKIIRAKSTCENSSSSPYASTQKFSVQLQTVENQASLCLAGASNDGSERIDIRVIQATPAVSPCTSIKTLSNESVDGTSVLLTGEVKPVPVLLSVQDRRRRFANARMKGQTIDHSDKPANLENINNSSRIWLEVPTFRRDSVCTTSPAKSVGGHPLLRPTRSCERPAGNKPHISRQSSMHIPQMCGAQTK